MKFFSKFGIFIALYCFMSIFVGSHLVESRKDHTIVLTYPLKTQPITTTTTTILTKTIKSSATYKANITDPEIFLSRLSFRSGFKKFRQKTSNSSHHAKTVILLKEINKVENSQREQTSTKKTTNAYAIFTSSRNPSEITTTKPVAASTLVVAKMNATTTLDRLTTSSLSPNRTGSFFDSQNISESYQEILTTFHLFNILKRQSLNISNTTQSPEPILLSIDNRAKEIILLSAAFATMLLSICFLLFILWFCCFTLMKQKKISARSHQLKRCLIETESNLNKIGIQVMPQLSMMRAQHTGVNKRGGCDGQEAAIYVRDAVDTPRTLMTEEQAKVNTQRAASASLNRTTSNRKSHETQLEKHSKSKSKTQDDEQEKYDNEQIFHPYDSLHLKVDSISSKKQLADKIAGKTSKRSSDGHTNLGFLNDYEYFNNERMQTIGNRYETSSTLKTIKNMPQLSRDQIEKEYIEFFKRDIDEKTSSTDSSSGIQVDHTISIVNNDSRSGGHSTRGKATNSKRPSLTSIKAKKLAAKQAREQIWQI